MFLKSTRQGLDPEVSSVELQPNLKTSNGSTALHNAALNGHLMVVDLLLGAGCSVNARNYSGATALYNAASGGHSEIVKRLVSAGSDLDARTMAAATALHIAASNGHDAICETLIQVGPYWVCSVPIFPVPRSPRPGRGNKHVLHTRTVSVEKNKILVLPRVRTVRFLQL